MQGLSFRRGCSQFLENLCDHLYDSLRPRILHEPRLEVLCELCTVLGAMMALDADTGLVEASDDSDDDELFSAGDDGFDTLRGGSLAMTRQSSNQTLQPAQSQHLRLGRLRFSFLLRTILEDTQTRLVFRAQAVIQTQVLHYNPTPDDLDYPAILEKKALASGKEPLWKLEETLEEDKTPSVGGGSGGERDKDKRFRVPNETQMKWWFPTLRRTVWVLARLNAFVNVSLYFIYTEHRTLADRDSGSDCHFRRFRRRSRHAVSTVSAVCRDANHCIEIVLEYDCRYVGLKVTVDALKIESTRWTVVPRSAPFVAEGDRQECRSRAH